MKQVAVHNFLYAWCKTQTTVIQKLVAESRKRKAGNTDSSTKSKRAKLSKIIQTKVKKNKKYRDSALSLKRSTLLNVVINKIIILNCN